MKIMREINGKMVEIKLTGNELYAAYVEQERIYDEADVVAWFDSFDDDELEDMYGMTWDQIEEKVPDIASEMRRNIDKYDMKWQDARDAAVAEKLCRKA